MFKHRRVDASVFDDQSDFYVATYQFSTPPDALWRSLTGTSTWEQWLPLKKVQWLGSQHGGVGARRKVYLGGLAITETFLVWEPNSRIGFRFDSSALPVRSVVEDYQIKKTGDGSALRWSVRVEGGWFLGPVIQRTLASKVKERIPHLERHLKEISERS